MSSYWLDETDVLCALTVYIGLVSIEFGWCRNSTGRVAVFPLGRERRFFVARCVKDGSVPRLGVVDLRGCSRESYVAYSRSTQVKL